MKILLIILGTFFTVVYVPAQIDADSIFMHATRIAQEGNYDQAITSLQILTDSFPANQEYRTSLGRVYSWKGDYDASLQLLKPIADSIPLYPDAIEVIVNTFLWSENYAAVIEYCDKALALYPESSFYNYTKALALEKLGQNAASLEIIENILSSDKKNQKALSLKTNIYQKSRNAIALSYLNTSFNNPGSPPRHLGSIEYKRNLKNYPIVARINYGNMFQRNALQFEIDLYPKLSPASYLYVNAGLSEGNNIFPFFRGGFEYYKTINSIDFSLGARFLNFEAIRVYLLTAHLAYNTNSWQLAYRPFINPQNSNLYLSHVLSVRRTNETKENFIQFEIQYGAVPFSFYVADEFIRTNSFRGGVYYQIRIHNSILFQPIFMYELEEYLPGKKRNRYNLQFIMTKRF